MRPVYETGVYLRLGFYLRMYGSYRSRETFLDYRRRKPNEGFIFTPKAGQIVSWKRFFFLRDSWWKKNTFGKTGLVATLPNTLLPFQFLTIISECWQGNEQSCAVFALVATTRGISANFISQGSIIKGITVYSHVTFTPTCSFKLHISFI